MYRSEDTDGEPLEYEKIELPELPLISRAEEWGVSVRAVPGNYHCYGSYSQIRKEIVLASPDESVLFHELAHHAIKQLLFCKFDYSFRDYQLRW